MMNAFFVAIVLVSLLVAAFAGRMEDVTQGALGAAGKAVELALGLVGSMAFFLGLMRVASDGGMLRGLARAAAPVLKRIFPEVPADHPAMSAMLLNVASNLMGLGNAATPFGIRAMMELDRLNDRKGVATDAMVTFLAINASGLALLPTTVIALRAAAGSKDPAGILFSTWFASGCATLAAVTAALLLARVPRYRAAAPARAVEGSPRAVAADPAPPAPAEEPLSPPRFGRLATVLYALAFAFALALHVGRSAGAAPPGALAREILSYWVLPGLIGGIVLFGWAQGVRVYASLVEGAKEGFQVALRVIPYLVAIFVAVGMFRASGALDGMVRLLDPVTSGGGLPAEALPVVLLRPLSGSGAYGIMAEVIRTHGPDSFLGYLVSTLQGSTETTFYVLALYFGAVGVKRTRHALPACLTGDVAGLGAAVLISNLLFR